jgi:hypothetical protein
VLPGFTDTIVASGNSAVSISTARPTVGETMIEQWLYSKMRGSLFPPVTVFGRVYLTVQTFIVDLIFTLHRHPSTATRRCSRAPQIRVQWLLAGID